jgi:glycosyltransferase involved in cell wall biosynthesis
MASFFQPAVYNPQNPLLIEAAEQRFLVYKVGTLPRKDLLVEWYQYVLLVCGAAFVGLSVLALVGPYLKGWLLPRKRKQGSELKQPIKSKWEDGEEDTQAVERSQLRLPCEGPLNSFGFYDGRSWEEFIQHPYDLHIVEASHLPEPGFAQSSAKTEVSSGSSVEEEKGAHQTVVPSKTEARICAIVAAEQWQGSLKADTIAKGLAEFVRSHGLAGLLIRTAEVDHVLLNRVVKLLAAQGIRTVALTQADESVTDLRLEWFSGVVFENGLVLPDGSRKGYFASKRLRQNFAAIAILRQSMPDFVLGGFDRCHVQPSPATIARAYRYAAFWGITYVIAAVDAGEIVVSADAGTGFTHKPTFRAFDWLKKADIMEAQKVWKNASHPVQATKPFRPDGAEAYVEGIAEAFQPSFAPAEVLKTTCSMPQQPVYLEDAPPRGSIWALSSQGDRLCTRGCFDLRDELLDEQYIAVLKTQHHLAKLGLLAAPLPEKLAELEVAISQMSEGKPQRMLSDLLTGLASGSVEILCGLDSGFRVPVGRGHFWGVSEGGDDGKVMRIYVSLKAEDFATVVIHVYLAHCGVARKERFMIELQALGISDPSERLHPRLAKELETASPAELLQLMQQIVVTKAHGAQTDLIVSRCKALLLDETSEKQWGYHVSFDWLRGTVTMRSLLETRLSYFQKHGFFGLPDVNKLEELSRRVDQSIRLALYKSDLDMLDAIFAPLLARNRQDQDHFNIYEDLYGLLVFCTLRKLGYADIYLETTDRCPMILQQKDMAAVFSELWSLGSSCEVYFGITPRSLGELVFDEYREALARDPPPADAFNPRFVMDAYSERNVQEYLDLQRAEAEQHVDFLTRMKQRLAKATFLSVFCVPAIADVCLLTFLGRGLYLTAFMTLEERVMANYAVLGALIISAGVSGWSGSGGGFYMYQGAFHNMAFFMTHRFCGGVIITGVVAFCGGFAFSQQFSWYGGFVFAAYLIALTTILNMLGILATMHVDGGPFRSGRTVLATSLSIMLIPPILTSFINGHDVAFYLPIMYFVVFVLLFRYSLLCHEWVHFPETVPLLKDSEILQWYENHTCTLHHEEDPKTPVSLKAAAHLYDCVCHYNHTKPWQQRPAADPFVVRVAKGHPYAVWLLNLEAKGDPLPAPYTSNWLAQTKVSLGKKQLMNKNLASHSAFMLYHRCKYDLASNVGFFLVALLDRWVAISMSANGHDINIYFNTRARYGIGFGLLYFLLSAIILDIILQGYWAEQLKKSVIKISDVLELQKRGKETSILERKRWLRAVLTLLGSVFFIFGMMSFFVWIFVNDGRSILVFFLYVLGYSGVVIFQLNRAFSTNVSYHVRIVFASAFLGYVLGIILHEVPQTKDFVYTDVICLCVGSWAAAIGTSFFTKYVDGPPPEIYEPSEELPKTEFVHGQKLLGTGDIECTVQPDTWRDVEKTQCQWTDGSALGEKLQAILLESMLSPATQILDQALPKHGILQSVLKGWQDGRIRLYIVDRPAFSAAEGEQYFSIGTSGKHGLDVYVGMPEKSSWNEIPEDEYVELEARLCAEALVHQSCQHIIGFRHRDASLAELLVNGEGLLSARMALQVAWSKQTEVATIISQTNNRLLSHLALGVDVDVEWHELSETVRSSIVARILGEDHHSSDDVFAWLTTRNDNFMRHDWMIQQTLAVYQYSVARDGNDESLRQLTHTAQPEYKTWQIIGKSKFADPFYEKLVQALYEFFFRLFLGIAVVTSAAPDVGREMWVSVPSSNPIKFQLIWVIMKLWGLCRVLRTFLERSLLLSHNATFQHYHLWATKGSPRTLEGDVLTIDDPRYKKTGFLGKADNVEVTVYPGLLKTQPINANTFDVLTYDSKLQLSSRESTTGAGTTHYDYQFDASDPKRRYPLSRRTSAPDGDLVAFYDHFGRLGHGESMHNGVRFKFKYIYASKPPNSVELIKAVYSYIAPLNPRTYEISWCTEKEINEKKKKNGWVPSSRVQKVSILGFDVEEEFVWDYEHKRDPIITRTSWDTQSPNMREIATLRKFVDEFGLLKRPELFLFDEEDLLFYHSKGTVRKALKKLALQPDLSEKPTKSSTGRLVRWYTRLARRMRLYKTRKYIGYFPIQTCTLRSALWADWAADPFAGATWFQYIDEQILRHEPTLKRYWRLRDAGSLGKAQQELYKHKEEIIGAMDMRDDVAQGTALAIKFSDLLQMGHAKDSAFISNDVVDDYIDSDDRVSVIFTDTGCWPNEPGGVSNCRRDLVNSHKTVRNYALTEAAQDYWTARYQVEQNVEWLAPLPLWGLDDKSPHRGFYVNLLHSQVANRRRHTRKNADISEIFVPLLRNLVRCARTINLSKKDITLATETIMNMNLYFENNDYLATWRSKRVRRAWHEAWLLDYHTPNIWSASDRFAVESPSTSDFDEALELWISYFFILSIRVPENVPRVYQATHHGVSTLWGMILKLRRGTALGIWDHGLLFRETCLNISPAQCLLPLAVQSMLLCAQKLAAHMVYTHADIILPCTALYNPIWEVDLGTDQGRRQHPNLFRRKINPILNGIDNMAKFQLAGKPRTTRPTAIMLSNVQFIKDVKNAVRACAVIVHKFGFKDYQLIVYGATDRTPEYAAETQAMIESLNIEEHCRLGGFGKPDEVLKDAWLFMNSSLSEGLPLAIGEAALCGVPIVATNVGATSQVLVNPDDPSEILGEVVPPNDPVSLARAQISLLAMTGPWQRFIPASDPATASPAADLPTSFSPESVAALTARMHHPSTFAGRASLGAKLRASVQRNFSGERYVREHEQMYWIQRHLSVQRTTNPSLTSLAVKHLRFGEEVPVVYVEQRPREGLWKGPQWWRFGLGEGESKDGDGREARKHGELNGEDRRKIGSVSSASGSASVPRTAHSQETRDLDAELRALESQRQSAA